MDLINKGTNLSCPLYITGECLNYLGANIDNNELFLLDGSRRISANLLLNINKIIWSNISCLVISDENLFLMKNFK